MHVLDASRQHVWHSMLSVDGDTQGDHLGTKTRTGIATLPAAHSQRCMSCGGLASCLWGNGCRLHVETVSSAVHVHFCTDAT